MVSDRDGGQRPIKQVIPETSLRRTSEPGSYRNQSLANAKMSIENPARRTEKVTPVAPHFNSIALTASDRGIVARSLLSGENRCDRDVHDDRIHSGGFADGLGITPGRSGRY